MNYFVVHLTHHLSSGKDRVEQVEGEPCAIAGRILNALRDEGVRAISIRLIDFVPGVVGNTANGGEEQECLFW